MGWQQLSDEVKPYFRAPKLQTVVNDSFEDDSREKYEMEGDVEWLRNSIRLNKNAQLHSPLTATPWCEAEIHVTFPALKHKKLESDVQFSFPLENGDTAQIRLIQNFDSNESNTSIYSIITDSDSKIRSVRKKEFKTPLTSGTWSVRYRFGSLSVSSVDGKTKLRHQVGLAETNVTGFSIGVVEQSIQCGQLSISTFQAPKLTVIESKHNQTLTSLTNQIEKAVAGQDFKTAKSTVANLSVILKTSPIGQFSIENINANSALGYFFEKTGQFDKAQRHYRDSYGIASELFGRNHLLKSRVINDLTILLLQLEQYEDASTYLNEAVAVLETHGLQQRADFGILMGNYGYANFKLNRIDEAEKQLNKAAELIAQALGKEHPEYLNVVETLADLFESKRELKKAEQKLLQIVETTEKIRGKEHYLAGEARLSLGGFYSRTGSYSKAKDQFEKAKAVFKISDGDQSSLYLNALEAEAYSLRLLQDLESAIPLVSEACKIREKTQGAEHPDYATAITKLGSIYFSLGYLRAAEVNFLGALDIRKKSLGDKSPEYASTLFDLGSLYTEMEQVDKAESFIDQSKKLRQEVLGKEHPDYVASLGVQAILFSKTNRLDKATQLQENVLSYTKKRFGHNHIRYADELHNLGQIQQRSDGLNAARESYVEALKIYGSKLGTGSSTFAEVAVSLADVYAAAGNFKRAESLYLESKTVLETTVGKRHPSYATCICNLAEMYRLKKQYAKAEPLFLKAASIHFKTFGENSIQFARTVQKLGKLFLDNGATELAKVQFSRASFAIGKTLGNDHEEYADALDDLGLVLMKQQLLSQALTVAQKAKEITFKNMGPNSAAYANRLNLLGMIQSNLGKLEPAEQNLMKARDIYKQTFEPSSRDYIGTTQNLAVVFLKQGEYDKAETLLVECVKVLEKTSDPVDEDNLTLIHNLANAYLANEKYEKAYELHRKVLSQTLDVLESKSLSQSSSQQREALMFERFKLNSYLSLIQQWNQKAPDAYDLVLRWKGVTLRRQKSYRRFSSDPDVKQLLDQIAATSAKQAQLSRTREILINDMNAFNRIQQRQEKLEKQLAQLIVSKSPPAPKPFTGEMLRQRIPNGYVLIDLIKYTHADWSKAPSSNNRYMAFVTTKLDGTNVVDLGPAAPIEAQVQKWRTGIGNKIKRNQAGAELRRLVWEPLIANIGDCKNVLLSADGELGRLPFNALPGILPSQYLIEEYSISLLSSPLLLVNDATVEGAANSRPDSLLTVGNIDYDHNLESDAADNTKQNQAQSPKKPSWLPLSETKGEIEEITRLFKESDPAAKRGASAISGPSASESAFSENVASISHLYLATHAFYNTDLFRTGNWIVGDENPLNELDQPIMSASFQKNPMSNAALVFAGANQIRSDANAQQDGILTALEISNLPMDHVNLVVMSACESGLGKIESGEGMLSLERAFQIGGARTVVSSLWMVDSMATRILMERFLRNLWVEKMTKKEALREAQIWMLRNPKEVVRKMDESSIRGIGKVKGREIDEDEVRTPPYYWAPWSLSGDWE